MQTGLAFHLEFMEEVEKPESECGAWPFPRCRESARTHELNTTESGGASLLTEAVGNADGMNAVYVKESKFGWGRWDTTPLADRMAKLVYDTKVG